MSVLLGQELEYTQKQIYKFQNEKFKRIQPNIHSSAKEDVIDCEGLLVNSRIC